MGEQNFLAGDRVRWGDDLGRVALSWDNGDFNVVFDRAPREVVSFKSDGSLNLNTGGISVGPRVELIGRVARVERPKQKRKVKVWRWEKVMREGSGWCLGQSEALYGENGWHHRKGWTKVPGSEREIEIDVEE